VAALMANICIITAGHLATCPRMLKAADALSGHGHTVRVVSGSSMPWAAQADRALGRDRRWDWTRICYRRDQAATTWLRSGLRHRAARIAAQYVPAGLAGFAVAARAYNRIYPELLRAALRSPADLYYAGGGAMAIGYAAGRSAGVSFAADLEDFHSGEQEDRGAGRQRNRLARALERQLFPAAAFLTTASEEIADAYAAAYHRRPTVIHNTFPLPAEPPDIDDHQGRLKMYWFSQTIGPERGLEDVIRAAGMASLDVELHLRGCAIPGYLAGLQRLAASCAPKLTLVAHDPTTPAEMVAGCREYQIGLALEKPDVLNRNLCLTNKALTYILAGLAVVFTDTLGQRRLARQLGEGALLVGAGDLPGLAAALRRWDEDRGLLLRARRAAWNAARERWHWEHECERGRLLKDVEGAIHRTSCE